MYSFVKAPRNMQRSSFRIPRPLSDQFPVRVCSCPLCMINRLYIYIYMYICISVCIHLF